MKILIVAFGLALGGCMSMAQSQHDLTPAATGALAGGPTVKELLVGSWSLVSLQAKRAGGGSDTPYGANGKGTLLFERNGRFAQILVNPDIQTPYASNNRETPTMTEAMAAAKGSFSFFGGYTVIESERTFVFHVEASSYPNLGGTDQKRIVKNISNEELRFVNLAPPGGGTITEVVYRRDPK